MNYINEQVKGFLANSSMIRRMFEAGIELKKQYGADNVYDFSLGNPDLPPPPEVKAALSEIASSADQPFAMGYMPNAGFPELREQLAGQISFEQQEKITGANVVVCCGAAGALNVFFRAVLSAGDEVLCPSPYFVEYGFYAGNYGGKLISVPTLENFKLDPEAFKKAINAHTRAIILNSPNNPTGRIYTESELQSVAAVVKEAEAKFGRPIYVISDEPYRFLNFDGEEIPPFFGLFSHPVIMGSCSKNLSLAGERIGYIAVGNFDGADEVMNALILCNRILGFVNAPVVGQKLLSRCIKAQVDLNIYRERRDAMAKVLDNAGIEYFMPKGAFYFFPKSPTADEQIFIDALLSERILAVPGKGFGAPGYFRTAFCVDKSIIERSAEGFKKAVEKVR